MAHKHPPSIDSLPSKDGVRYRLIAGFTGYAVGTDGSVWTSLVAGPNGPWYGHWRRMRPTLQRGYLWIELRQAGKPVKRPVHALVLEAFVGPCPEGMECCHYPDRTRTNNSLGNLAWGTKATNCQQRTEHGTLDTKGEKNGQAKLTALDVLEIRTLHREGFKFPVIARMFNVNRTCIQRIVTKKRWRHV